MGCCFSSPTRAKRHPHPQNGGPTRRRIPPRPTVDDRAPPPTHEEEYVKEVLSETPLPKLHPEAAVAVEKGVGDVNDETEKMPVVREEKVEAKLQIEKLEEEEEVVQEVSQSQVSEMCSVSESFSTATTFTEKRDEEVVSKPTGEVAAQRASRSPAKVPRKRPYSGELTGGRERVPKSPARRAEPSPEKKGQAAARSARGGAAQSRTRQPNGGFSGARRDPGEGSGRRSRSPVTRASVGRGGAGKSPMKQTGRAGGRSQNACSLDSQSQSQSKSKSGEETQNGTVSQQQGNESIENPHVSLECFIFL